MHTVHMTVARRPTVATAWQRRAVRGRGGRGEDAPPRNRAQCTVRMGSPGRVGGVADVDGGGVEDEVEAGEGRSMSSQRPSAE